METEQPTLRPLKDPDSPASSAMIALMTAYKMTRSTKPFTAATAQRRIYNFFVKNPAAWQKYLAERDERRKRRFRDLRQRYVDAATARQRRNAASAEAITALMAHAFQLEEDNPLRLEIMAALSRGVGASHAFILSKKADGTFVPGGSRRLAAAA
jgi:hypothetical protein